MYKKIFMATVAAIIVGLSGCGGRKKEKSTTSRHTTQVASAINMPLAQDEKHPQVSFFDEDLGEFESSEPFVLDEQSVRAEQEESLTVAVQEPEEDQDKDSLVVYYEYDSTQIRPDQQAQVAQVKNQVKKWLDDGMKVVFKGHSCKWHGTADYNVALSKQRASSLAQVCIADADEQGVKTFGVGNEELIAFENSIDGQAPNRRVEVYALAA